ncbi:MAG: hypothetical protein AB1611_07760 [bacterium]
MATDMVQEIRLRTSIVLLALVVGISCIISISSLGGCGGGGGNITHENPGPGGPGQVPDEEIPIEVPADSWGQLPLVRIMAEGELKPKIRAVFDSGGNVHISCLHASGIDGEYQLSCLSWNWKNFLNPAGQELEPVAGIDNCQVPAFTLTRDNCPVLAYRGGTLRGCSGEEPLLESDAIISLREKGAWSSWTGAEGVAEKDSSVGLAGTEVSIVTDSKGYIHLSYQLLSESCRDKSVSADLYYLKKHRSSLGSGVLAERVEEEDRNGERHFLGAHCSIILDRAENPVIFHFAEFSDRTKGLRVARKRSDGTWRSEWIEQGCEAGCISCARDVKTGYIGVAYQVKSYTPDSGRDDIYCLRYAVADEQFSTWELMMVDDSVRCGDYCSLAFDSQGCPAIAYYEIQNLDPPYPLKNLKFAYLKNGSWNTEVIASQGDIGLYNSLWLDKDNRAFICSCSTTDETVYLFYRDLAHRYDSGESSE